MTKRRQQTGGVFFTQSDVGCAMPAYYRADTRLVHATLAVAAATGCLGAHYPVIALIREGSQSDVPGSGYNYERRATDIHEFLQPYQNVLLVGWSLGALEVLEYIHRFGAERLAGMVLVDSSVGELPVPPPGGGFLDELRKDRDKTLDSFVREMYETPSDSDCRAAARRKTHVSATASICFHQAYRASIGKKSHACRKPLLYVVTPQFEEQNAIKTGQYG
jgi:microsomal epoxide hydrolase